MVDSYIPKTLDEALAIIAKSDSMIFAGGTDLMIKNKNWDNLLTINKPIVFIANIPELKSIRLGEDSLIIGAGCTCAEIIENPLVPNYIKDVMAAMASPAIRNTATLGGNICNSSPVADSLPLLYACETKLLLKKFNSSKIISLKNFITAPGKNILNSDEILVEIIIPIKNFNKILFKKVGTRKSIALAKLSFMGMAEIDEITKEIKDIRLAFGAVAPTIVKSDVLEEYIIEEKILNDIEISKIIDAYSKLIVPITDQRSDKEYRKIVSLRLLEKFLKDLI